VRACGGGDLDLTQLSVDALEKLRQQVTAELTKRKLGDDCEFVEFEFEPPDERS